jgi:hypothetical protein
VSVIVTFLVNCKIVFVEMTCPCVVLIVFEERVGVFQVTVVKQVKEHVAPRIDQCVTIRSYSVVWRHIVQSLASQVPSAN